MIHRLVFFFALARGIIIFYIFPHFHVMLAGAYLSTKSVETLGESIENVPSCSFLSEQMLLLCYQPHVRRYSVDMIICAFRYIHHRKALDAEQQKVLTLLSISVSNATSSNLHLSYLVDPDIYIHLYI